MGLRFEWEGKAPEGAFLFDLGGWSCSRGDGNDAPVINLHESEFTGCFDLHTCIAPSIVENMNHFQGGFNLRELLATVARNIPSTLDVHHGSYRSLSEFVLAGSLLEGKKKLLARIRNCGAIVSVA